jgi:type IV pilus assembly protein PilE
MLSVLLTLVLYICFENECKMNKKLKGFTLTELLVVLVIIGILVLLALPDHTSVISKAKATEAKMHLENVYTLQRTHFYEYSRYANDLEILGYEQQKLVTEGGAANYKIEIVQANGSGFVIRATAVVDFDQDGKYNVWEVNQEKSILEIEKD